MTVNEIIQFLRLNIDKVITVKYANGDVDLAHVLTVDDEGFVYDLVSLKPEERKTEYWTSFSEITEVQLADGSD